MRFVDFMIIIDLFTFAHCVNSKCSGLIFSLTEHEGQGEVLCTYCVNNQLFLCGKKIIIYGNILYLFFFYSKY